MSNDYIKRAHFVLQGKGGVGKSLISALIAMAYEDVNGVYPVCLDTDPVNATLAGFKSLQAETIKILENDDIVQRNFDLILESIVTDESQRDFIIDNGASSFIPLLSYLISNEAFELLESSGVKPVIHTVVAGGQSTIDTLGGLQSLLKQVSPVVDIYVWLNPFHGEIMHNKIEFGDMKIYKDNKDRFKGIINLPKLKEQTHGHDFSMMLKDRLTFKEALKIQSPNYNIMTKQRLKMVQKSIFEEISHSDVIQSYKNPVTSKTTK